jgi:hypothetical protein
MQSFYAARFERDMACTESDWKRWLPDAIGQHHWKLKAHAAGVCLGHGALGLKWQITAPRVIALVRLPRLQVSFRFVRVNTVERHAFMKRFDLYMQRGGG